MKKVRWGVIGAGGIAKRRTIPEGISVAKNAELVAVYNSSVETGYELAKQYQALCCETLEELVAAEIDAVYVATPTNFHKDQVISAARAGKHVLCEKPVALNVADSEKMLQACQRAGVHFSPGFMMRYHPAHQMAKAMILQGRLGTLLSARAQLSCWFPAAEGNWRQSKSKGGGGCVPDLASHCLDLLCWLLGDVATVSANCSQLVQQYTDHDVEDTSCILLSFESGATGMIDTYFSVPDSACESVFEIYGSKGSIRCKRTLSQEAVGEMTIMVEKQGKSYDAAQHRKKNSPIILEFNGGRSPYLSEIEEFSQAILEGIRRPFRRETPS